MPFPHVFEPLRLRHKTLTSRITFGAHTANMALDGYPRIDNPWATVEEGATVYEITEGDTSLTLDFDTGTRTATG